MAKSRLNFKDLGPPRGACPSLGAALLDFKAFVRAHANIAPGIYNSQHGVRVLLHSFSGKVHDSDLLAVRTVLSGPEAPLFVDVGGNIGQSVVSLKTMFPHCTIHSFEPNPVTYRNLAMVARRYRDVFAHNIALGAEDGVLRLHVPSCQGVAFHQLASTLPPNPQDLIAFLHARDFRWVRAEDIHIEEFNVPVRSLDSFGLSPAFIKVDVEGAELSFLKGAYATLARSKAPLLIERHDLEGVSAFLAPLGYSAWRHDGAAWRQDDLETEVNVFFRA